MIFCQTNINKKLAIGLISRPIAQLLSLEMTAIFINQVMRIQISNIEQKLIAHFREGNGFFGITNLYNGILCIVFHTAYKMQTTSISQIGGHKPLPWNGPRYQLTPHPPSSTNSARHYRLYLVGWGELSSGYTPCKIPRK